MTDRTQKREPRPISSFERIRRARRLTQEELAVATGVSRSYIAMCEQGWHPPRYRQKRIAAALKADASVLWPNTSGELPE